MQKVTQKQRGRHSNRGKGGDRSSEGQKDAELCKPLRQKIRRGEEKKKRETKIDLQRRKNAGKEAETDRGTESKRPKDCDTE